MTFYRKGLAIGAKHRLYKETFGSETLAQATGDVVHGSLNDPVVQEIRRRFDMIGERVRGSRLSVSRGIV